MNTIFSLQLLADGGGAGAGAMGASDSAAMSQGGDLSNVKYGIQDDGVEDSNLNETPDVETEFEKLIKGQYKDQYNRRVQDTVQKRLKSTKDIVDKYNALSPTLDFLSKRYGVDVADVDALNKAIENDESYYEDEAIERGITVEQLKEIKKMERENSALKKAMQEQQAREDGAKLLSQWTTEADATKMVYPAFDFDAEMENPDFRALLNAHVGVQTAYEVLHKDEIIPAAMQYAAKTVEQKLTNKIVSNGARPVENGNSAQSASVVKKDVAQLTRADRAEIAKRVARGEKIRF